MQPIRGRTGQQSHTQQTPVQICCFKCCCVLLTLVLCRPFPPLCIRISSAAQRRHISQPTPTLLLTPHNHVQSTSQAAGHHGDQAQTNGVRQVTHAAQTRTAAERKRSHRSFSRLLLCCLLTSDADEEETTPVIKSTKSGGVARSDQRDAGSGAERTSGGRLHFSLLCSLLLHLFAFAPLFSPSKASVSGVKRVAVEEKEKQSGEEEADETTAEKEAAAARPINKKPKTDAEAKGKPAKSKASKPEQEAKEVEADDKAASDSEQLADADEPQVKSKPIKESIKSKSKDVKKAVTVESGEEGDDGGEAPQAAAAASADAAQKGPRGALQKVLSKRDGENGKPEWECLWKSGETVSKEAQQQLQSAQQSRVHCWLLSDPLCLCSGVAEQGSAQLDECSCTAEALRFINS